MHNLDIQENNKIEMVGDQEGNKTVMFNPHEKAQLLGKRKKRTYISPEERRIERKRKKEECIELTIDEKRADEADELKPILKRY